MGLLRWIDETAKINRGKLKIWKKPDIPDIASATLNTKKNNETTSDKKYTDGLLAEVCLDMICNHLNKMFSGKDVCIPSKFMPKEKCNELIKQLQIFRNSKDLDDSEKKIIMMQITKSLAAGFGPSALASEILSSFPDKQFLEIAMLPENLTLESIFASSNPQESWTFVKLCDLIGKNPKKFAKQLETQPKLRDNLIKEVADTMQQLLICRTPYSINDSELIVQYYKEGMLFEEHDQVSSNLEKKGARGSKAFPSHLGIIRHLVKSQMQADEVIYKNFLEQVSKYQKGQIPKNKLPQLPSIDHHPTNIQAMPIAKTSRNYLIKILKTHPDKNLLKMCQNKHYPKWYIVRKIIETDNQSRNTFVDIPEKGRDVLEWGNKHLPRNKPPVITEKDAYGNFTPHLSEYWYEESFNRASILFDLTDKDRPIFKLSTEGSLKKKLAGYNANKERLKQTEYEKRREIENEKKESIQEGSTISLPRSSMLSLIADYELLPVLKNLQQQARTYSKRNPKRLPEQVAEHIVKTADKKNFFAGLNPKIYDKEKLSYLIAPAINSTSPAQGRKILPTSSRNTHTLFEGGSTQQEKRMGQQPVAQGSNKQLTAKAAQHGQDVPSTKISNTFAKEPVAKKQTFFAKQLTQHKTPTTNITTGTGRIRRHSTQGIPDKVSQTRPRANSAKF